MSRTKPSTREVILPTAMSVAAFAMLSSPTGGGSVLGAKPEEISIEVVILEMTELTSESFLQRLGRCPRHASYLK